MDWTQEDKTVGGLLVVREVNYVPEDRRAHLPLTHEAIAHSYKGIEGQVWPEEEGADGPNIRNGLAPLDRYEVVKGYYLRQMGSYPCHLIYCHFDIAVEVPPLLQTDLSFCGYDCGYYKSAFNHYSAIFNEVIYGSYPPLTRYSTYLNSCLLLPSLQLAHELRQVRYQLLTQGADLEDDEECSPIAVYSVASEGT